MTPVNLIIALAERIKAIAGEYNYKNKAGVPVPVKVYPGWAPQRAGAAEDILPCICILPVRIDDDLTSKENGGLCTLRVIFGIREEYNQDSWQSILNLVEHVRQGITRERILANKYMLRGKIETEVDPEQPYPHYFADMTVQYFVGRPVQERKGESWRK